MVFLWIFGRFECVSSLFCLKLLQIFNFTKCGYVKDDLQKHFCIKGDGVLCAKEIQRLDPMDLKIYSLERNPRL